MACNDQNTNCAPCQDCPPSPQPILPRCQEVVLLDGAFINATVVVEQGCITSVTAGEELAYQPDNCCGASGGGGGGSGQDGIQGPPGPSGQAATISIGSVSGTAFGNPPQVTNSGTPSNAILNFVIPGGEQGADGSSSSGANMLTDTWEIEDGSIKELPPDFPPICTLLAGTSDIAGLTLAVTKNNATGVTTISIDDTGFYATLQNQITNLSNDVLTLQTTVTSQQTAIGALQAAVTGINAALVSLDARVTALEGP